eukprot:sb/3474331/
MQLLTSRRRRKSGKACKANDERVFECREKGYEVSKKGLVDEDMVACEYIFSSDHHNIHTALIEAGKAAVLTKWKKKENTFNDAIDVVVNQTIADLTAQKSGTEVDRIEAEYTLILAMREREIKVDVMIIYQSKNGVDKG